MLLRTKVNCSREESDMLNDWWPTLLLLAPLILCGLMCAVMAFKGMRNRGKAENRSSDQAKEKVAR